MKMAERDRRPAGTGAAGAHSNAVGTEGIYSNEAAHANLSPVLIAEMSRLYRAGFWLLPLGSGDDGRKPSLGFVTKSGEPVGRHPLELVLAKMVEKGTRNYVIRPKGMLVVDIDTDTPEAHAFVAQWFGASPVQVKTGKGVHHWYRFEGKKPRNIRQPRIAIDFKAGTQDLVAGPYAERQDGVHYWPLKSRLESIASLPEFIDRRPTSPDVDKEIEFIAGKVAEGSRNTALYQRAISYVAAVDTLEDLIGDLQAYCRIEFDRPDTVGDAEIRRVAGWAWQKRLENNVWAGRNSGVTFNRSIMDRLLVAEYGADAWALYCLLLANFGHIPGQVFPIAPDAMRAAGLIKMSRNHIYRARDVLVAEGLLISLGQDGLNRACRYQLAGAGRIHTREKEGGFPYYLDTQFRDMGNSGLSGEAA